MTEGFPSELWRCLLHRGESRWCRSDSYLILLQILRVWNQTVCKSFSVCLFSVKQKRKYLWSFCADAPVLFPFQRRRYSPFRICENCGSSRRQLLSLLLVLHLLFHLLHGWCGHVVLRAFPVFAQPAVLKFRPLFYKRQFQPVLFRSCVCLPQDRLGDLQKRRLVHSDVFLHRR